MLLTIDDYIRRDFKASNVLLKITCSCLNPLVCTCRDKYSVVVADFDASVQLDDLNQLPPTDIQISRNGKKSYSCYRWLPLGTIGFRAPECAFHVISSTQIIYPPISSQCDMFSFGAFCLGFFIGKNGPKSQKHMAMMLLSYYQEKGSVEGRNSGFLKVTSMMLAKILKVLK